MATSYTWSFPTFDVTFNKEGLQNVIQTIHWVLSAQDGENIASCYGSVGLSQNENSKDFISYEQLTPQQIETWTQEAIGKEELDNLKAGLEKQIQAQKNPTNGNLQPPWI